MTSSAISWGAADNCAHTRSGVQVQRGLDVCEQRNYRRLHDTQLARTQGPSGFSSPASGVAAAGHRSGRHTGLPAQRAQRCLQCLSDHGRHWRPADLCVGAGSSTPPDPCLHSSSCNLTPMWRRRHAQVPATTKPLVISKCSSTTSRSSRAGQNCIVLKAW